MNKRANKAFQGVRKPPRRLVREFEVLRVPAVFTNDSIDSVRMARERILEWAEDKSGAKLPSEAWNFASFDCLAGGRNSSATRIKDDDRDLWALRHDDPDKTVAGRVWTIEAVVGFMAGSRPAFSMRLLCNTPETRLEIEPHTPAFVATIAGTPGLLRGGRRVLTSAQIITSDIEAGFLVDSLIDPARLLPTFVLTVSDSAYDPYRPAIDAHALARACVGMAQVAVVPGEFTSILTGRLGKHRTVFGGAIRAYLPGFAPDSNPYAHRLIFPDLLATSAGQGHSIRWLRSLAANESLRSTTLGKDVLAYSQVRSASLSAAQDELEKSGASEAEQLQAALRQIEALESQIAEAKDIEDYYIIEFKAEEKRAEAAEEQARASAYRIHGLLDQLRKAGAPIEDENVFPTGWADFVDWCDIQLAGRLVLSPRARSNLRAPKFEDFALAARCLVWLATVARDRRLQGGDGSLSDVTVEPGIRNAHCGADQFNVTWQGQPYTADWHIKNGGNTRRPERCLRIYYFWEPNTQQIVIAEMPAHRVTGAT